MGDAEVSDDSAIGLAVISVMWPICGYVLVRYQGYRRKADNRGLSGFIRVLSSNQPV